MDVNTGTPAAELADDNADDDENEYGRGKYIYPAGITSRAARRQFRNMIRSGAVKAVAGVNVQAGAEISFRTKENSKASNSERKLLQQLRTGR